MSAASIAASRLDSVFTDMFVPVPLKHLGRVFHATMARQNSTVEGTGIPDVVQLTRHVRRGSESDITNLDSDVRFTPESGSREMPVACPLCANSGLYAPSGKMARFLSRRANSQAQNRNSGRSIHRD